MSDELELGHDHFLRFYRWAPDDLPENRARYGDPLPRVERAGALVRHRADTESGWCEGAITFDLPETRHLADDEHRWNVVSWEPLSLSPSIKCSCGDHGYITDGRWVPS